MALKFKLIKVIFQFIITHHNEFQFTNDNTNLVHFNCKILIYIIHYRTRRRSNSGDENSRRRSSLAAKSPSPIALEDNNSLRSSSRLHPGHETARSPIGSPSRRMKPKVCIKMFPF